ncbi:helix-hairpin-helix domain-containing protein [Mesorhizobium sp. CA6]|uniref:ComEA family DNA-binding protein n=1 Tax=Mesorhizobium sp. CA6 TaxID=588500 RepID=UPI001CCD8212|nr:helix-hairpin-helix domain-containing protein [Mesorhizobium sp. CA6]
MAGPKTREAHHAGEVVDINSATIDELMAAGGLHLAQASAVIEARPLASWREVARLPGFDPETISRLRAGRLEIRTL